MFFSPADLPFAAAAGDVMRRAARLGVLSILSSACGTSGPSRVLESTHQMPSRVCYSPGQNIICSFRRISEKRRQTCRSKTGHFPSEKFFQCFFSLVRR